MKVIEIYPGDGSVLVSQGPSAQFFQHIIPQEGKVGLFWLYFNHFIVICIGYSNFPQFLRHPQTFSKSF